MPSYRRTEGERLIFLEDEVKKLRAMFSRRQPLNRVANGDFIVENDGAIKSDDFDGTGPSDPGTVGWWLGGPGDGAVFATAVFRDGIIGNDALANPVTYGANGQAAVGFAVPLTAPANVVTQTIPVPAGYTRAVVHATGAITAIESAGSADYLSFSVLINGTGSAYTFALATPNQPAHVGNSSIRTLTGLSGGVITFTGSAFADGHAWTAQPPNVCTINATALFLR